MSAESMSWVMYPSKNAMSCLHYGGIWRGEGQGKGGERGGQFTSNLRPRWTDPVTARRVPSK
jgi:hypothetical protein